MITDHSKTLAVRAAELRGDALARLTDTLAWMLEPGDPQHDPVARGYSLAGLSPSRRTARLAAEAALMVILAGESV